MVNIDKISLWVALIGATNIGLAALGFNVIDMITGAIYPALSTILAFVIGASGAYQIYKQVK